MFNLSKLRKTKLSLALSTALVGGALSMPAQATGVVQLANDGLGDAALFQYFTANDNWQTLIRLINTDPDNVVAVKVHFREAANSREILDFIVLLSPNDMWTAWTDKAASNGGPGIRTNDTSCIIPLPDSAANREENFKTISGNLKAAAFKDRAFTGVYDDGSNKTSVERMSEGHIEVIAIASFSINNLEEQALAAAATHAADGKPESCASASLLFNRMDAAGNAVGPGRDAGNVIGANAYLINIQNGQGAGYDPTILANFSNDPLTTEAITTDTKPDLDSGNTKSVLLDPELGPVTSSWAPVTQILANGAAPTVTYSSLDLNNDGDRNDVINIDLNGNGICQDVRERNVPDTMVGLSYRPYLFGQECIGDPAGTGIYVQISAPDAVGAYTPQNFPRTVAGAGEARRANLSATGAQGTVRGGVDAVSALLMRTTVVNEWAASYNPQATVSDYFTQWVLNFPTKHYYVDIQDDKSLLDDVAPTLWDPNGDYAVDPVTGVVTVDANDAFAPFSHEFNMDGDGAGPDGVGLSCEYYSIDLYNREESEAYFSSPRPYESAEMCYETNVLTFNEAYIGKGLNSNFDMTVPLYELPRDRELDRIAERGWARLNFEGIGANTGLTSADGHVYYGLPVDGFMFSVYNTASNANNLAAANAHKYERSINGDNITQVSP